MNILVTGGAGFIGNHLVRTLIRENRGSIGVLDNLQRGSWAALKDVSNRVHLIEGDIRDNVLVKRAARGMDIIFHLAAQSSVMSAAADSAHTASVNGVGTRTILEVAAAEGIRRVVFTSSREVYGDSPEIPVSEDAPIAPKNAYGVSKAEGEQHCRRFADRVDTNIVRIANVYGPGDRDRVLPLFLDAAFADRPLMLYGGEQVIDFVWVETVVAALICCGFGPLLDGPVNVGSGKGCTVAELAYRVIAATCSGSAVVVAPSREIEVSRFVADVSRARELFGLIPPDDPLFRLGVVVASAREACGR